MSSQPRTARSVLTTLLLSLALLGALSPAAATSASESSAASGSVSPWGRDYFPNIVLINQDGQKVRFFDDLIKGKVVAINFIFTACGDSCPLETARLRQVQNLLGERVGRDVFLYSISIDPISDTPEVLKRYTEKFNIGPGWQFLTGDYDEINLLRQKLGLFIDGVDDQQVDASGTRDHNLSLIIGNQSTGRWMKASPFENPYILADRLGSVLHNWKQASVVHNDYAEAPDVRTPSAGEQIYRTRCASCHTLGDTQQAGLRSLGPDLLGVTRRRDPAWLSRWIREPDRMLAEKDPLAMALLEQYNRVPMPNLRLGEVEISALLAYLEEESNRQNPPQPLVQESHDAQRQHPR